MMWSLSFLLAAMAILHSVCSHFNPLSLEELGSNTGIQIFNQIVKARPHDNIVVSPHGIASALGMLQLGADGRTKKQLTLVMRYSVNGTCGVSPPGASPPAPRSKSSRKFSLGQRELRAIKDRHGVGR